MSDNCSLLTGKSEQEQVQICLKCTLDDCRNSESQPFQYIYKPPVSKPKLFVVKAAKKPRKPTEHHDFFPVNCSDCARHGTYPQNCLHPEWFSPSDIRFCRDQIMWGLENLSTLRSGSWPRQSSGYNIDAPGSGHRFASRAAFESPAGFAAEIEIRFDRLNRDVKEVIISEMAAGLVKYNMLARFAQEGINYMCGWRRRKEGFAKYRCDRKRQIKDAEKKTLNNPRTVPDGTISQTDSATVLSMESVSVN